MKPITRLFKKLALFSMAFIGVQFLHADKWQALVENSPFGIGPKKVSAAAPVLELCAVLQEDRLFFFSIYNTADKTSLWLPSDREAAGLKVESYEPSSHLLVLKMGDRYFRLILKQASIMLATATPAPKPPDPIGRWQRTGAGTE